MTTVNLICEFMEKFAPTSVAEDWDNVGLLIGDRQQTVQGVMTCLTITPESVEEAIKNSASVIVSHHPMPFQAIRQITSDTTVGKMILDLAKNSIAVYSPHTAFDSASRGINQQIAQNLDLQQPRPINLVLETDDTIGSGRIGQLKSALPLAELVEQVKKLFGLQGMHFVGQPNMSCNTVAVACGSGGSFLNSAIAAGADTLITGETNFHTCLEAKARGVALILVGHFPSERFAVENLAEVLAAEFPDCRVWASTAESDPVNWL